MGFKLKKWVREHRHIRNIDHNHVAHVHTLKKLKKIIQSLNSERIIVV